MANPSTSIYSVGVDLGGTNIRVALVDRAGGIRHWTRRPTRAEEGPERVVRRIQEAIADVLNAAGVDRKDVVGIGIGAPGPLDWRTGVVLSPPNLPGWRDVPLRAIVEDAFGLPTYLENDANVAALAEHRLGAGVGAEHLVYMTVSTGIGAGVIVDGKLYRGESGGAGEIGHMVVKSDGPQCACGNRGCLEALASGTAIARRAEERRAESPRLRNADPLTAVVVAEAARAGDATAKAILDEAFYYLGIGVVNVIHVFNPRRIVIGGGLAHLGEALLDAVGTVVARHAFAQSRADAELVLAKLGDRAGVLGAALLCWEHEFMGKGERSTCGCQV